MSLLNLFRTTLRTAFDVFLAKPIFQKQKGSIQMTGLRWYVVLRRNALVLVCLAILGGCASLENSTKSTAVPEIRPGILAGYLPAKALPNSLALIPAPPAADSSAFALDEEIYRQTRALRGTPRWELAT